MEKSTMPRHTFFTDQDLASLQAEAIHEQPPSNHKQPASNNSNWSCEPSCTVCGKNGPFSKRQLKRATSGESARCLKCIEQGVAISTKDNAAVAVADAPAAFTKDKESQSIAVADAPASDKRKRVYFSDGGSVAHDDSSASSSLSSSCRRKKKRRVPNVKPAVVHVLPSTSSATSPGFDVSLDAIKRKVLGRSLRTNDSNQDTGACHDDNDNEKIGAKNIADLRKDLSCAICHDLLHQPLSLHCGHSFCGECLNWWLTHSQQPPTDTVSYGNCPTCRRGLTCDGASLGVNTALRECIATLFGDEWRARTLGEQAAKRKATAGENGGAHKDGYQTIEATSDAVWEKVPRGSVTVRRSIVMDADDQRMQLSLALQGDDLEVNTNGSVKVTLCLLTMEEDEASDGGFPLVLNDEDDNALIATEDRFQHSYVDARAKIDGTSDVPIVRRGLRQGLAQFDIDVGTPTLRKAVSICFRDEETGAELEIRLPGRSSLDEVGNGREIRPEKSVDTAADDDSMDDNEDGYDQGDNLDEFEEDGFVVADGDEMMYDSNTERLPDEESDEEEEQPVDDLCCLCNIGGELMICDGGENFGGCGRNFHIECVCRKVLPPGDWVCETCANEAAFDVGLEGYEFPVEYDEEGDGIVDTDEDDGNNVNKGGNSDGPGTQESDEDDESVVPARKSKVTRRAIFDSDDED